MSRNISSRGDVATIPRRKGRNDAAPPTAGKGVAVGGVAFGRGCAGTGNEFGGSNGALGRNRPPSGCVRTKGLNKPFGIRRGGRFGFGSVFAIYFLRIRLSFAICLLAAAEPLTNRAGFFFRAVVVRRLRTALVVRRFRVPVVRRVFFATFRRRLRTGRVTLSSKVRAAGVCVAAPANPPGGIPLSSAIPISR